MAGVRCEMGVENLGGGNIFEASQGHIKVYQKNTCQKCFYAFKGEDLEIFYHHGTFQLPEGNIVKEASNMLTMGSVSGQMCTETMVSS